MYSPAAILLKYLAYRVSASNGKGHGIHSPFVFEFVQRVLNDKSHHEAFDRIEKLRKKLLADATPVPIEDYGAGSDASSRSKSVSSIASRAAKSSKYARLLFRIVRFYKPGFVLELGTSLGISTAYLASAHQSVVLTGEGNYVVASLARKHFDLLNLSHVQVIIGNFDNTLSQMAASVPHIDLAFVDGNHREQPTLAYFNVLLERLSPSSIVIFDDIHWSREMESAWKKIKEHPSVMLTIDLFFMGIVVFRPDFKVKQHFRIKH